MAKTVAVAERVRRIVVDHLGVKPEKATDNAHFIEDLGADSLDCVELMMSFEEEFGIEIKDEDAEKAMTVAASIALVEKAVR